MSRMTANRKKELMASIDNGSITIEHAIVQYQSSHEEIMHWYAEYEKYGVGGLKVRQGKRRLSN